MQPTWQGEGAALYLGDCLPIMAAMPDNSVDLIATDPPYYKVKMECDWDRQWKTPAEYLAWIGLLCEQWQRILKPNGSLYVFASPDMGRKVANVIEGYFCILNEITWRKNDGTDNEGGLWSRANKDDLRSYFPQTERIIFAEHYGADNIAKGEAGYAAKCDQLRGFVFEPIRAYLKGEVLRAGLTTRLIAEAFQQRTGSRTVTGMAGHWLEQVQWSLPTADNYAWLQELVNEQGRQPAPAYGEYHEAPRSRFEPGKNGHGPEYLRADYEYLRADYEYLRADYEYLRADYEDLRADYEDLRRPFFATLERPYTDVWEYATVPAGGNGKHPAEKPLPLMEHIILTSSKPGAVVLDCCMGRGTTGQACLEADRQFIGIDSSPIWFERAMERLACQQLALPLGTL